MIELSADIFTNPEAFSAFKNNLENYTGLEKDALHIYMGTGGWLLLTILLGRRWWSGLLAWMTMTVITLWGEWMDLRQASITQLGRDDAGMHDIWNTMLLPTLLLLTAWWLFKRRRPVASTAVQRNTHENHATADEGSGERADQSFE